MTKCLRRQLVQSFKIILFTVVWLSDASGQCVFQKYYSERMERKLLLKSMFCLGVVTTQWLHFLRIIEERHLEKMFEILEMMFCHFSRPQALPFPFVIFIATHQIKSRSYICSVLNQNSIFQLLLPSCLDRKSKNAKMCLETKVLSSTGGWSVCWLVYLIQTERNKSDQFKNPALIISPPSTWSILLD